VNLDIDTREELESEARILSQARQILARRFSDGKYEGTARAVRSAAVELISRSRHPSRNPSGPWLVPDDRPAGTG
jgi:hypothetical protein